MLDQNLICADAHEVVCDEYRIRRCVHRKEFAHTALCVELTDTATRYPGTDLTLAYSIKGHPGTK